MSHMVFQSVVAPKPLSPLKPSLPIPRPIATLPCKLRRSCFIRASSSSLIDSVGDSVSGLERCLQLQFSGELGASSSGSASPSAQMCPEMKGGKFGSVGAVTLEKGKLDMTQKKVESTPELFDRKFVDAVLNEWQKTMLDLPAGLRQAYEMGLVSSAQMVKFLAINARPTTTRFISRALPQGLSRAFVGRMLADPSFLYRLLLEQAATVGCSVWWEVKTRKDRIKEEWDLALINVLTVSACNAAAVWLLAPCRSYGNTFRFDLQNTLQKLPNNVFEMSYPLREFDLQKRIHSLFYKAAELSILGVATGTLQGSLSNFLAGKKKNRVSVTVPSITTNALGYGAFLGLYANLRYQLLCGFERAMSNHFDVIGVALFFGTAVRIMNVQLGERSRQVWLGVEADPLAQPDDLLAKAYNRPSEEAAAAKPASRWFISKNAIVSGLLGLKQQDSASDSTPPKARRKRIVRKKVAASSAP
ncbi:hypothetical protein F2Q69_00056371 [Brassica cretica]|uniref:Protein RETICULATA-RELATED 1, chloroplastic n=1 Tax=Brassica cretica TaxID=69181 RepID=A0A8S9MVG4_BRACR|nr:hypothetical protein F2Q69_00056371 [Brassica cretica]